MTQGKGQYDGRERRKPENAPFRRKLDRVKQHSEVSPYITEAEVDKLFELARIYCRRAGGIGSPKVFRMILEERGSELSAALVIFLEDLLD